MKSLRTQLLLGVALGTTVVWLVSGSLLYALISRAFRAEFDESLGAKARSLAMLADQDEEGLDFDPLEVPLPEFAVGDGAQFFQLWLPDGTVFARSPSLQERDLHQITWTPDVLVFHSTQLPDGRAGRIVGLTFLPRQEWPPGYSPSPTMLTMVVGREIAGLEGTLTQVRRILMGVCLAAVLVSGGVLAWVVRRSLKPVDQLVRSISDVGERDLSTRIDASGIPLELLPVVERLNDLLVRLQGAFDRERRFTGDVAHELRTPLAGLRSKLELALTRDRTADAYRKTIDDSLRINLQMQRMVENLLHLARADAGQLEVFRGPVDLPELIRECWLRLEDRATVRGLSVKWRVNTLGLIETDRDKLQLVIQNVLDNAVAYANDQGRVTVSTWTENGAVGLTVDNTGSTVPADRVQNVFDRFWRGDFTPRETGENHWGLGLPLCKAIVEQLGGSIAANTSDVGVFTITMRLPSRSALRSAHCD